MRKTNLLLVYPEVPDTYWSMRYAMPLIGKKALLPPLGLLTVAALFPEERFDIRLIDMNVHPLRDADIAGADLVMLSAMIVQKESLAEVALRCRRHGVPVAAGGPYPSSCREEIHNIDHFILGEGEETLPAFIADWIAGRPAPLYESVSRPSLDSCPIPRFDLVDHRRYATASIQFSRGCPFSCEFCDIIELFGRVPRTKSPERFIAELEALRVAGAAGRLFIVDDNFIGNKARVKELLRALIPWQAARGFPFRLITEASIDLAQDEELLDLMAAANFRMVFVGLETPSAEALAAVGKGQNLRTEPIEATARIQRKGIEVSGGFILGFDEDPPDIFARQIAFIRDLAVPVAMVGLLTALPKTALYARLLREGRILEASSGDNTGQSGLNFRPLIPASSLIEGYLRVIADIYRPRAYFERCLDLLRRLPESRRHTKPGEKGDIGLVGIGYLLRSLAAQAFSTYGFEYLRFVFRALRISPLLVGDFIALAIQGRHFFIFTRRTLKSRTRPLRASRAERLPAALSRARQLPAAAR